MLRASFKNIIAKRHSSSFNYKKWSQLSTAEQQSFVTSFVENYKKQFPGSKTNVSLRGLAMDMEKYNDAPSVFGIFYNDIWEITKAKKGAIYGDSKYDRNSLIKDYGRFGHETFHDLLIE